MNARRLIVGAAWTACAALGISACERPYQRFVPFSGDNASTALDTKTGQSCITLPKAGFAKNSQNGSFPFCADLYKETK